MALDRGLGAVVERLVEHGGDWASRVEIDHVVGATHCGRWNTPAFFRVATAGVVAACIRQGADVNVRLEGRTWTRPAGGPAPLHVAAQWTRDPAVIPVLVRSGAEVNARDDRNNAPLHLAIRHNPDPAVAAALLEAGAEVNAWATGFFIDAGWDYTPLHEAVVHKNPDVTATLLQAGADVHAGVGFHPRDRRGMTPIHAAAARADDPVTISLLVRAGADVNVRTNNGHTPLHEAAATNNNPAVIETMVEAGADVNARAAGGRTPLHMAAAGNSNPAVVSALLKAGADLRALTATGSTALLEAASGNRNPAVLESLVAGGADASDRDELGRTPLHLAALRNPGVFPALLRLGADLTARDDAGGTPPGLCANQQGAAGVGGRMAMMRLVQSALAGAAMLLLHVAPPAFAQYAPSPRTDPDPPSCEDWKAGRLSFLQSATPEGITLCLESGADVHARDDRGNTPLHIAVLHTEAIAVATELLAAGADASAA